MDLFALQASARLTDTAAAELCGYSLRGWRRMKRGHQPTPKAVIELLRLYGGDLGALDERWDGWCLHDGRLWIRGNARTGYTTIEIFNMPMLYTLISKLERQIEALLTPASNIIPMFRRECARARARGVTLRN